MTPLLFDRLEFIVFAKPTFVEIGNRRGSARSDVETSVFRGRGAKIGECCEGECPQSAIFRLILLWRRSNYEFSVNKTSFPAFILTPSRKFKQASNFAGTSRNFCRGRALNRQEKKENSLPLFLSLSQITNVNRYSISIILVSRAQARSILFESYRNHGLNRRRKDARQRHASRHNVTNEKTFDGRE